MLLFAAVRTLPCFLNVFLVVLYIIVITRIAYMYYFVFVFF